MDGSSTARKFSGLSDLGLGFAAALGGAPDAGALSWDPRRATWMLYCPLPLAAPVTVNRRAVAPGEQIPLTNLDVIEVPGAFFAVSTIARAAGASGPADRSDLARY